MLLAPRVLVRPVSARRGGLLGGITSGRSCCRYLGEEDLPNDWLELATEDQRGIDQFDGPSVHQSYAGSAVQARDFEGVLSASYLAFPVGEIGEVADHAADEVRKAERFLRVSTDLEEWDELRAEALQSFPEWRRSMAVVSEKIHESLGIELQDVNPARGQFQWLNSADPNEARQILREEERAQQESFYNEIASLLGDDVTVRDVRNLLESVRLPRYGSPAEGIISAATAAGVSSTILEVSQLNGAPVAVIATGGTVAVMSVVVYYGRILVRVSGEAFERKLRRFFDLEDEPEEH